MNQTNKTSFETRVIHQGPESSQWEGGTLPPIFQSVAHRHLSAENLSRTFAGKESDHIYMRLTNPTNRFLEEKLAALESGAGAVVTASGMAAVSNAAMALLRSGDEFVAGNSLFLSTYILFTTVIKKYGITVKLVDMADPKALKAAITSKTRFVYLETIGNPKMDIPDMEAVSNVAHEQGLPLLVDNTLATPWLFRPLEHGADVVVHSTTKFLSGHGAATGGVVVDGGTFDWTGERFSDFKPFIERKGKLAFLDRVWREHHINFGTTQAPFHSFLTVVGLDTLALRMERQMENARTVARYLADQEKVLSVNYPGFKDHPNFPTAQKQFGKKGFGAMLTFRLEDQAACFRFLDSLKLICQLANLGDCKTLAIHPYSSQYITFEEQKRIDLAIFPNMIRLSVGIEGAADICRDLGQALEAV